MLLEKQVAGLSFFGEQSRSQSDWTWPQYN